MIIKFKRLHPDAIMPKQANPTDTGYDIYAIDNGIDFYDDASTYLYTEYRTGLSIEPPKGYYVEIAPRSSLTKYGLMLKNSFGIIDNEYRGEMCCRYFKVHDHNGNVGKLYVKGDKIAQLIIRQVIHADFQEVDNLSDTARGKGGFGSSDKVPDKLIVV